MSSRRACKLFFFLCFLSAFFAMTNIFSGNPPSSRVLSRKQSNTHRQLETSKKQIGAGCYFHSSCGSGACSSSLFASGQCVECVSDQTCEGQGESLPGEHPKAFCFENACSQWKHGKPIDERGYPIWMHGTDEAMWHPRVIVDEGPVMEQVWHWELNNQPDGTNIAINGTHALIPLNSQTIAGYSRTYHHYNEHETGIITTAFLNNPMSVVTPRAHSGMIEKYHTLTYNGEWSTRHVDLVEAEVEARSEQENDRSESKYLTRSIQMGAAFQATSIISQQLEAAQDDIHLDQIRDYVQDLLEEDSSVQALRASGSYQQHSNEAKQALEDAKTMPALKSENHCKHFEEDAGIGVSDTHIAIPLDSAFVTLSGEMVFAPSYYLGINAGVNIATYDETSNTLEFYYKVYQQSRQYTNPAIPPQDLPYPSGLYVSSVHPENYPVSPVDGRTDQYYHETRDFIGRGIQRAIDSYLSMPIDYSLFDRPESVACPDEKKERLKPKWEKAGLEEDSESGNLLAKLTSMVNLFQVGIEGAPCGSNYMHSDYKEGVVGLELNTFGVWLHLILEIDQQHTEAMATSDFWDDWQTILAE